MQNGPAWAEVRRAWAARIMAEVADPARWLERVMRDTVALRLNPARAIPLGTTLELTLFGVLQEADKQGRELSTVRATLLGEEG